VARYGYAFSNLSVSNSCLAALLITIALGGNSAEDSGELIDMEFLLELLIGLASLKM
jgi:hypothetical protein